MFDSGPFNETKKRVVDYYLAPSYFSGIHSKEGPTVAFDYDHADGVYGQGHAELLKSPRGGCSLQPD